MAAMKILVLFCFTILFLSCSSKESEISGEIFIVTNGAENIRLGAVSILAIPEIDFDSQIQTSATAVKEATAKYKAVVSECAKYTQGIEGLGREAIETRESHFNECQSRASEMKDSIPAPYFKNLPPTSAQGLTDSNGRFILKISKVGRYAIVAQSERKTLNKTERYFWAIWVDADETGKQIILTNKNMIASDSPDSAIILK